MGFVKDAPAASGACLFTEEFQLPWQNLACDEALLDYCETSGCGGFLRFWESPEYFVVLGYSKKVELEVYSERCAVLGIPILRRCSGGGTVLQGPGCLNYALILPIETSPDLHTISGANRHIMERIRSTLVRLTGFPITIQGHTDLTIGGRKFSGNAQRRKRRCLLFHGAFLIHFNLDLIAQTLRPPPQQPAYRAQRDHGDFLANVTIERPGLMQALASEWNASRLPHDPLTNFIISNVQSLHPTYSETKRH